MAKKNQVNQDEYAFWVKLASRSSILVALILLISKLYAWFVTDASAILASVTDSLLDVFASIMNFVILHYALMPADDDHKFGHGKAESLAGLVQAAFVLGSSVLLVLHGIERIIEPRPISQSDVGIWVTVFAIVLTLALVILQKIVINKTQSVAINADSLHYQSDLLLNAGVILAIILSQHLWLGADGLFTLLVGIYLAYGAVNIAKISVEHLMDRELPDEDIQQIITIANLHEAVFGIHDVRTRQAGVVKFVQFHLELDDNLSLYQAHQIAEEVEQQIKHVFGDMEVFIHQDPQSVTKRNHDV